jgi:hypothetical protein
MDLYNCLKINSKVLIDGRKIRKRGFLIEDRLIEMFSIVNMLQIIQKEIVDCRRAEIKSLNKEEKISMKLFKSNMI